VIIDDIRPWLGESRLPIDWPIYGTLPVQPCDPNLLSGALFHVESPKKEYVIQVYWEPPGDTTGHYLLRLFPGNLPDSEVIMRAEAQTAPNLRFWLKVAIRTAQDFLNAKPLS
jgi:hypothetical protein